MELILDDLTKAKVQLAFDIATKAHENQVRRCGEPYINHCIRVTNQYYAENKQLFKYGQSYIDRVVKGCCVALLHDVLEDCVLNGSELKKLSSLGDEILNKIRILSRNYSNGKQDYYLRIAEDAVCSKIKGIDRLDNLKDYKTQFSKEKLVQYIKETEDYIIPISKYYWNGELIYDQFENGLEEKIKEIKEWLNANGTN